LLGVTLLVSWQPGQSSGYPQNASARHITLDAFIPYHLATCLALLAVLLVTDRYGLNKTVQHFSARAARFFHELQACFG